jgi:hypothetical protein
MRIFSSSGCAAGPVSDAAAAEWEGRNKVNGDAPLRQRKVIDSFDTAAECRYSAAYQMGTTSEKRRSRPRPR